MNQHVISRLAGIHKMLVGAYESNVSLSSNTKGVERQTFIDSFLSQVLPSHYRFGTGDATDQAGNRSGQLDVVIEYPFVPSLPIVGSENTRLYLAEGISAAIEVKSDLSNQWYDVEATANKLAALTRRFGSGISFGPQASSKIPFFVVGFKGWKTIETMKSKLRPGVIDGILDIESLTFCSTPNFHNMSTKGHPCALWCLICCLHFAGSMGGSLAVDAPLQYVLGG